MMKNKLGNMLFEVFDEQSISAQIRKDTTI